MGRKKSPLHHIAPGTTRGTEELADKMADPWRRKRKERINHSAYNLPNLDVHGILFAVVAVVFVVYPLIQWALGRYTCVVRGTPPGSVIVTS